MRLEFFIFIPSNIADLEQFVLFDRVTAQFETYNQLESNLPFQARAGGARNVVLYRRTIPYWRRPGAPQHEAEKNQPRVSLADGLTPPRLISQGRPSIEVTNRTAFKSGSLRG